MDTGSRIIKEDLKLNNMHNLPSGVWAQIQFYVGGMWMQTAGLSKTLKANYQFKSIPQYIIAIFSRKVS